jgi:hypothetical protein
MHRKQWEFAFVAQALSERGLLAPGKRGLGFGVGREPLPSLFASLGCAVVASDQSPERAAETGWTRSGQHSADLMTLNDREICEPVQFTQLVSYRMVDMRSVPDDLVDFDFVWSTCSLEHLGSLAAASDFVHRAMSCLRCGGFAVHTTEFNASSNHHTIVDGPTVLYRKRDLEQLCDRLRADGSIVELELEDGHEEWDDWIDLPPFQAEPHLKLLIGNFVATSVGLIVQKG